MAIALIVMNDTAGVARDEELVVLAELDAGDARLMVIDDVHGATCPLVQLKYADLVVEVPANVEVHITRATRVIEISE